MSATPTHPSVSQQPSDAGRVAAALTEALGSVVSGRRETLDTVVAVYLAGGHLLVQDVPGVGKTTLAKALARCVDLPAGRIQFTPDLMPGDITGVNVYDRHTGSFAFRPGAIFAGIVVADEINRASPKTQSAVLEAMAENQVTVDGTTHPLSPAFFVIATQNPSEMEGTYPLPEAQRDRFMARLSMGYPDHATEVAMLERHATRSPLSELRPVTDEAGVLAARRATASLHASEDIRNYVVALTSATREDRRLRLGASPRASIHLLQAARGHAVVPGRDHVLPQDVQAMAVPVLAHRTLLAGSARLEAGSDADVIRDICERIPVHTAS